MGTEGFPFYYLMVIKQMCLYEPEGEDRKRLQIPRAHAAALIAAR